MDRSAPASLKLTAYVDERRRGTGGRFVADELLDLFERHHVATSIALRGIGGFGPQRVLRSDRTLSLSEDPPIAVTAVDTRAAIEDLLEPLRALPARGLVTLERARLIGAGDPAAAPAADPGGATKLTVYLGRKDRVAGVPAHVAVCALMHRRGLAGASVFLGVDGTRLARRRRAHFVGDNADVPVMVIVVGDEARVAAVLPELAGLLHEPVITVERVRICKRDGLLLHRPPTLPGADDRGRPRWQKLMVYTSAAGCHDGEPIHRALLRRLYQRRGARGATAVRGIWGFHGQHRPHGDRWWALTRRVPVATIIIDTPAQIADSFAVVDEVTAEQGLVTSEVVPALLSTGG